MSLRRTRGIVTDRFSSDAGAESDVIMTAAALGLAADYIATRKRPLQLDMDPLDASHPDESAKKVLFEGAVSRMNDAVSAYLERTGLAPGGVSAGLCPGYWRGAMIMGVYELAGRETPTHAAGIPLVAPQLSRKGRALWDRIRTLSPGVAQYTGRGAYTGFVDNKNSEGDTDPVGPRSTVRMLAPASGSGAHPRWLPPSGLALWGPRRRKGTDSYAAWGLIGGDKASKDPGPTNPTGASNLADQIEREMRDVYGMAFVGDPGPTDVATYTHGMIQAIYKAYALGPSCEPYEIAVGDLTKKMASCLPCTLFMHAAGYPPTSIHLGSGESWAPLFAPYNPDGPTEPNERGVVRDLNNAWYARSLEWLTLGLEILDEGHLAPSHAESHEAVRAYLKTHASDTTVGGILILDALTLHEPEVNRIARTLR
jgi:hypothetical protein